MGEHAALPALHAAPRRVFVRVGELVVRLSRECSPAVRQACKGGRVSDFSHGRLAAVVPDILSYRRAGLTLQTIGDRFGVSREAIRLVCDAHGAKAPPPLVQYVRLARAVAVAARLALRDSRGGSLSAHGTRPRYLIGCRCEPCTRSQREYQRTLKGRTPPRHGTVSAYMNYGCRCDHCKEAGSVANRNNRVLRLARSAARTEAKP